MWSDLTSWNAFLREPTSAAMRFSSSILASYMVMFHAARTILFFDGFREKSHACVARYLEEKYVKTGKLARLKASHYILVLRSANLSGSPKKEIPMHSS